MAVRFPLSALVTLTLGLCWPTSVTIAQQPVAPNAGCMQSKGNYTCNWSTFQPAFNRAHTVTIQTGNIDRSTAAQLRNLIAELGKTEAAEGQPADLTFAVAPSTPTA